MKHDTCVCCGVYVPEGRQVCYECEMAGCTRRIVSKTDKENEFIKGLIKEIDKEIDYCYQTDAPIFMIAGLQSARMIVERKLKV